MMDIAIIVGFAIVVEAVVNVLFGDIKAKKWGWVKKVASFLFGIGLCFFFQVQMLRTLGIVSNVKYADFADQLITGIIASRGSNYINKWIVSKLPGATNTTTTTRTPPDTSCDDTTTVTSTTTP